MKPHFFSILFGDFAQRLRIPNSFLKHIRDEASDIAIIEGPSGSCWKVKVKRRTNGYNFEDGWDKFSSDHSLSLGDFLLFSYDGYMKFKVLIFGMNACERKDAFLVCSSQDVITREDKKRQSPSSDATAHQAKQRGRGRRVKKKHVETPSLSNSSVVPCSQEVIAHQVKKRGRGRPVKKRHVSMPSLSNSCAVPCYQNVTTHQVKKRGRGRPPTEHGVTFTSQYPYFIIQVKKHNSVLIPTRWARDHLPHKAVDITMQNLEEKTWTVKIHFSRRICYFGAGWKNFRNEKKLREGDRIAFELVGKLILQVHIFQGPRSKNGGVRESPLHRRSDVIDIS